jgi:hypothetical protein
MYKCENNYIENTQNLKILQTLNSIDLPWKYNSLENFFLHQIIIDGKVVSYFSDLIEPFTLKIKNKIQHANYLMVQKNIESKPILENKNSFKEDTSIKAYYFVNTSNGHITINLYDKVNFLQNRVLLFDNQLTNKIFTPTDCNQFLVEIMYLK